MMWSYFWRCIIFYISASDCDNDGLKLEKSIEMTNLLQFIYYSSLYLSVFDSFVFFSGSAISELLWCAGGPSWAFFNGQSH